MTKGKKFGKKFIHMVDQHDVQVPKKCYHYLASAMRRVVEQCINNRDQVYKLVDTTTGNLLVSARFDPKPGAVRIWMAIMAPRTFDKLWERKPS